MEAKVEGAKEEHSELLCNLQKGDMVLRRSCPEGEGSTSVMVWLDSGNVTLNVSGASGALKKMPPAPVLGTGNIPEPVKVEKKKKGGDGSPKSGEGDEEIVNGVDLLLPLTVEAEIASWHVRNLIGHAKTFKVLALAPSGQMCVTCDSASAAGGVNFPMKCIDCESRPPAIVGQLDSRRRGPHGQMHDIACDVKFSPDGNLLVSLHETADVLIWDTNTFRVKRAFTIEDEEVCEMRLLNCSWSSDGKYLAFAADYTMDEGETVGATVIEDLGAKSGKGRVAFFKGHGASCISISFSPDGKHVASGDKSGALCIRAVDGDGTPVHERMGDIEMGAQIIGSPRAGEPTPAIKFLEYRYDGKMLLSGSDQELVLWDTGTGQAVHRRTVVDESGDPKVREKFSTTCFAIGGWILSGVVSRLRSRVVLYNARFEEVMNFRTKAPPTCISSSRARACVGDMFGNHYCVDWDLRVKPKHAEDEAG